MQKVVAIVLVALALAFASIPSRTSLSNINGTVAGLITNTVGDLNAEAPVLYRLWVPENAGSVDFYLNNLNYDDCTYIDIFLLSFGAPCVDDTFNINGNSFCLMRTYDYSGSYEISDFYTTGYSDYYFVQRTGQYVYIGISTESSYTAEACSYSFSANVNSSCAVGQIAHSVDSETFDCYTPTRGSLNNFTQTVNNVSTTNFASSYYFPVAQGTGQVTFNIQSTEYLYAYGASNYGASDYRSDCYTSSDSNGNNNYTLTLTCIYPESGYFSLFIDLYDSPNNDFMNYAITTSVNVCNATAGGLTCTSPATALDINNLTTINVGIPYVNGADNDYQYWYLDVPTNNNITGSTQVTVSLGNTTGNENAYVVFSKNTYPDADHYIDSDQYEYLDINEQFVWLFTFHDFFEASRLYLGVYCYDGTICNITISFNSTGGTTTGSTTGSTSVSATTTGSTSVSATTTGSTSVSATTTGSTTVSTTTTGSTTVSTSSNVTVTTSSASGVFASLVVLMIAALL